MMHLEGKQGLACSFSVRYILGDDEDEITEQMETVQNDHQCGNHYVCSGSDRELHSTRINPKEKLSSDCASESHSGDVVEETPLRR
jgi:hypothetical protein